MQECRNAAPTWHQQDGRRGGQGKPKRKRKRKREREGGQRDVQQTRVVPSVASSGVNPALGEGPVVFGRTPAQVVERLCSTYRDGVTNTSQLKRISMKVGGEPRRIAWLGRGGLIRSSLPHFRRFSVHFSFLFFFLYPLLFSSSSLNNSGGKHPSR